MSEPRDRRRERLVRVAIAENPATAAVIQDTLEQAGIRSMLKNRDALAVTWGSQGGPFSAEVYVLEGDADLASALLGGETRAALPPPALEEKKRRRRWWW